MYQRKYRERDGNGYKVSLPFKIENTGVLQITDILVSAAYSTAEPWCCQVSLFLSPYPSLTLSFSDSICLSTIYHLSIQSPSLHTHVYVIMLYKFRNHSFKHFWHTVKINGASLVAQVVNSLLAMQETQVQSLGQDDPLEKGMATHSSILAQRIPWTEEPGGPQSMGLQRIGHD